ncbi:ABC transporter ATP-binding protein [Kitasatospora sp. NPDC052896]|uniref:ABC transporter ATP-binding protein n=1 Tax=Kitasatospora sp. NPDC052896 TaxID=3364061 RepID=UPI0037C88A17
MGTEPGGDTADAAPSLPLREVFRRFWPYTRGGRRWFWLVLFFGLLTPALEAAELWLFKVVIDDVVIPRDLRLFVPIALAYLALTLAGGLLGFADTMLSTWVSERFLLHLRADVFRHVQRLSPGFFERRRLGDLLSRVTGDVDTVETFLLSGTADAAFYVLQLGVFIGVLSYLSWSLTLLALLITPLFWLAARRFSLPIKAASRERRRRTGSISSVAEEVLGNISLVQAYNRQDWEQQRFERENVGRFDAAMTATRISALFGPVVDFFELAGALLVLGLGTWQITNGTLSLGGLLVFLALLAKLYEPVHQLSQLSNTAYAAAASAERIIDLLDQRPQVTEPVRPRTPEPVRGEVEFDGVSFHYPGTSELALSCVSFRVAPGSTLAIVGASGAGKSTAAKLLLRFADPLCGSVRLDGVDLRERGLAELREDIAVVLQETLVFHGTIRDNIRYGRPDATDAEITAAARAADADEFIRRLPEGYDTVVGQRGQTLSGGQRQRLAIARAMVRDAPVLLLDEPTTGLDAESGERVLEPLRRLMNGRTTIIISHNLRTVRDADQILLFDHGRITERGTHLELLARGAGYARLHRLHGPDGRAPRRVRRTSLPSRVGPAR